MFKRKKNPAPIFTDPEIDAKLKASNDRRRKMMDLARQAFEGLDQEDDRLTAIHAEMMKRTHGKS